jgi:hypothetical protein
MKKRRYKVHLSATALVHADKTVWADCPQNAEIIAAEMAEAGLVKFKIADVTEEIDAIVDDDESD